MIVRASSCKYFEDPVKLCSEHHVPLRLELASHERLLSVQFALSERGEDLVREDNCNVCLGIRGALVDGSCLLQVDGPKTLLACGFLDLYLEDTLRLKTGLEAAQDMMGSYTPS